MLPPGQYEVERLKVLNISSLPNIDIQNYRLKITGKVENSLEFSYDDLLSMDHSKVKISAHCVEGWSVLGIEWEGIATEDIISICKPEEAEFVLLRSLDGYSTSVPIKYFKHGVLAMKMNGETIPMEHGFPVRAVIPDLYFWKSAKWLCEIDFTDSYRDGFWEKRGYHVTGDVWLEQRRE